jgi:hypothetical protein
MVCAAVPSPLTARGGVARAQVALISFGAVVLVHELGRAGPCPASQALPGGRYPPRDVLAAVAAQRRRGRFCVPAALALPRLRRALQSLRPASAASGSAGGVRGRRCTGAALAAGAAPLTRPVTAQQGVEVRNGCH